MIYSAQIRAARGLVSWSQHELATAAQIGVATVKRMEASPALLMGNAGNIWRVKDALEAQGVIFIEAGSESGPGVRLRETPSG